MPLTNIQNYSVQTGSYALLPSDDVVVFSISAAANATLPTAVGCAGKRFTIKRSDVSAFALNILTTSSQLIDTRASGSIYLAQADSIQVVSDGTNWKTISLNETISAKIYNLNGASSVASDANFIYKTKVWDTHTMYNNVTGAMTAPRAGKVRVTHSYYGTGNNYSYISVNGGLETTGARLGLTSQTGEPISSEIMVNAGDTISVKSAGNHTVGADGIAFNYVIFEFVGN